MRRYLILNMYERSTPNEHDEIDTHVYDVSLLRSVIYDICQLVLTCGMFFVGVGLKYVTKYGHYKDGDTYKQEYAFMVSGGVAIAVFGIAASRMCHEWSHVILWDMWFLSRKSIVFLYFVVAVAIAPLARLVDVERHTANGTSSGDYARTGYEGTPPCPKQTPPFAPTLAPNRLRLLHPHFLLWRVASVPRCVLSYN